MDRATALDEAFPLLLEEHGVLTAGVRIVRGGELEWAGYYGANPPGWDTPAVFLAVAAAACIIPARRAAGIDPAEALRSD